MNLWSVLYSIILSFSITVRVIYLFLAGIKFFYLGIVLASVFKFFSWSIIDFYWWLFKHQSIELGNLWIYLHSTLFIMFHVIFLFWGDKAVFSISLSFAGWVFCSLFGRAQCPLSSFGPVLLFQVRHSNIEFTVS